MPTTRYPEYPNSPGPGKFKPAVPELTIGTPPEQAPPETAVSPTPGETITPENQGSAVAPTSAEIPAPPVPSPEVDPATAVAKDQAAATAQQEKKGFFGFLGGMFGKKNPVGDKSKPKESQPLVLVGERSDALVSSPSPDELNRKEQLQRAADAAESAKQPAVIGASNRYSPENQVAEFEDKNKAA